MVGVVVVVKQGLELPGIVDVVIEQLDSDWGGVHLYASAQLPRRVGWHTG